MDNKEGKTPISFRLNEITPKSGQQLLEGRSYYRSILYKNFMFFFAGSENTTKPNDEILYYDLDKSEWNSITPSGRSDLDMSKDYSVCLYDKNKIFFYGARLGAAEQGIRNYARERSYSGERIRNVDRRERRGSRSRSPHRRRGLEPQSQILTITESAAASGDKNGSSSLKAFWSEPVYSQRICFLQYHTGHVHQNNLYLFGGQDERFQINPRLEVLRFREEQPDRNRLRSRSRSRSRRRGTNERERIPRFKHCGVLLNNKIYYYGGADQNENILYDMWSYDIKSEEWQEVIFRGLIPTPRADCLAEVSGDTIFFLGGVNDFQGCPDLISYDVTQNIWRLLDNEIGTFRKPKALAIHQETIIIAKEFDLYSFQSGTAKNFKPIAAKSSTYKACDRQLFTEKPFPDITFNVEGTLVPAHKAVLTSRSNHFKNVFQSGMKETTSKVIDFPEMKLNIFNGFLEYLYCGEVNSLDEEVAVELLKVSDKYGVSGLRELSEKFLVDKLGIDNVIDLTKLADLCGASKLFNAGLTFMAENFEEIFKKYDIKKLSSTTLMQLFEER